MNKIIINDFFFVPVPKQARVLAEDLVCLLMLSHVQLFVTLWTVACQAPLSMGFFRQEYWNGWPLPLDGEGLFNSPLHSLWSSTSSITLQSLNPCLLNWTCLSPHRAYWYINSEGLNQRRFFFDLFPTANDHFCDHIHCLFWCLYL